MHLQRVQVPDFRVLKDIDITFEKDFFPCIFPLGSLNGGGKSTLLQLIFILLYCSADENKHEFIRHLLEGFEILENSDKRVLAKFEIWDGEKIVNLEFFVCTGVYLGSLLNLESNSENHGKWEEGNDIAFQDWLDMRQRIILENQAHEDARNEEHEREAKVFFSFKTQTLLDSIKYEETRKDKRKQQLLNNYDEKILLLMEENNLTSIYDYCFNKNDSSIYLNLVCCIDTNDEVNSFLEFISKKIFLVAPSTQVFLFLNSKYKKLLFKQYQGNENYYFRIQEAKSKLINFYVYDALSTDILLESFKKARDKDFEQAIDTGQYGNCYQDLLNDFNKFLMNKKINVDKDLSGVNFKSERNGEIIELYPEDLSHGELKRLSLYVWLKYNDIENAIILFDEIEIALHPDWQYQIVRDLEEWGPTNQYILATHSYELCQALTPAHVKEIEPKLLNQAKK